jgi:hypothetical protein
MQRKIKVFITALYLLIFNSVANAQWWNPIAPKDFNDCIIKNLKDGMGEDATNALKSACYEKYPPQTSQAEKREEILKKQRMIKCGIQEDHWKFHWFLSISEWNSNNLEKYLNNIKIEDYDTYGNLIKVQNKNSFPISGVLMGMTKNKSCPSNLNAYDAVSYCKSNSTDYGVISSMSYGKFKCDEIPPKSKKLGYCLIGYSPQYNRFDDSLIKHHEAHGFCSK